MRCTRSATRNLVLCILTNMLRPHQIAAIDQTTAAVAAGCRRPIIVMPPGGGKTRTGAELARRCVESGGRLLWTQHREELVRQSYAALTDAGVPTGCIYPDAEMDLSLPCQTASLQTLLARGIRPPATLVIADECAHLGRSS